VGTFSSLGKPRKPPGGTEGGKFRDPAGQKLMGIALMPYIPDNLILRRPKGQVQGIVSSTTPRLEAKCPPFRLTVDTRK
jgi:hypothetical protein